MIVLVTALIVLVWIASRFGASDELDNRTKASEPRSPEGPAPILTEPPPDHWEKDAKQMAREGFLETRLNKTRQRREELGIRHWENRGQYLDYLRSRQWREVSRYARRSMSHKCEFCGAKGTHVHHIYYPESRDDLGLEDIAFLCVVCSSCHDVLHGMKPRRGFSCSLCGRETTTDWLAIHIVQYGEKAQPVCIRCKSIALGFRDEAYGWATQQYMKWIDQWRDVFLNEQAKKHKDYMARRERLQERTNRV